MFCRILVISRKTELVNVEDIKIKDPGKFLKPLKTSLSYLYIYLEKFKTDFIYS